MEIKYAEDLIVLVRLDKKFFWYISDKELWIMDYKKYAQSFDANDNDFSERFDIGILDNSTVEDFLKHMKKYRTTVTTLTKEIEKYIPLKDWDEVCHLFPTLYIDFDKQKIFSLYPESLSFEDYVPTGWTGEYEDFYNLIPMDQKYWVIDSVDHLAALLDS